MKAAHDRHDMDGGKNSPPARRLPALVVVTLLALVPLLIYFGLAAQSGAEHQPFTDGACPADVEVAQRAVYLIDLRKPVDSAQRSLPGQLLATLTYELPAGTELGVYALSAYAEAPRTLIGRLCKTFDNGELVVATAKDWNGAAADCDELPAQMSAAARADAAGFCRQRNALRGRIDALAAASPARATDAHLLEALEETSRDFDGQPGLLYLFSDMMQHASWYSHLDLPWEQWNFAELKARRQSMPLAEPLHGFQEGVSARVFYVARGEATTLPEQQGAHKQFWRDYFGAAQLVFDDQPVMAAYAAASLMNLPTEAELASYERERLRYSQQLAEQERAELEQGRRMLAEERQALAQERRRLEENQRRFAEAQRRFEERLADSSNPSAPVGGGESAETETAAPPTGPRGRVDT